MYQILIVDDEKELRDICVKALKKAKLYKGFEILWKQDGPSALSLPEEISPHLIILDKYFKYTPESKLFKNIEGETIGTKDALSGTVMENIRNKQGFIILGVLKKKYPHIPIIFYTDYPEQGEEALEKGAIDYHDKDNARKNPQEMIRRIKHILHIETFDDRLSRICQSLGISTIEKPAKDLLKEQRKKWKADTWYFISELLQRAKTSGSNEISLGDINAEIKKYRFPHRIFTSEEGLVLLQSKIGEQYTDIKFHKNTREGFLYTASRNNSSKVMIKILDPKITRSLEIKEAKEFCGKADEGILPTLLIDRIELQEDDPFFEFNSLVYLVLEAALQGYVPLDEHLNKYCLLSSQKAEKISDKVRYILSRLHGERIAHGNLSPDKILVQGEGEDVKIYGLGEGGMINPEKISNPYLFPGLSPEKNDNYATKIIHYEMLTGKLSSIIGGYDETISQIEQKIRERKEKGGPEIIRLNPKPSSFETEVYEKLAEELPSDYLVIEGMGFAPDVDAIVIGKNVVFVIEMKAIRIEEQKEQLEKLHNQARNSWGKVMDIRIGNFSIGEKTSVYMVEVVQDGLDKNEKYLMSLKYLLPYIEKTDKQKRANPKDIGKIKAFFRKKSPILYRRLPNFELKGSMPSTGKYSLFKAVKSTTKEKCVLKIYDSRKIVTTGGNFPQMIDNLTHAYSISEFLSPHPYILVPREFFNLNRLNEATSKQEEAVEYLEVLELLEYSSLSIFTQFIKLDLEKKVEFSLALAEGLYHIHSKNVAHLNISPESIVVSKSADNYIPKYTDFRNAEQRDPSLLKVAEIRVTPHESYRSPELDRVMNLDELQRCDILSLGVIFYEFFKEEPFLRTKKIDEVRSEIETNYGQPRQEINHTVKGIVRKMISPKLEERPSSKKVVEYLTTLLKYCKLEKEVSL